MVRGHGSVECHQHTLEALCSMLQCSTKKTNDDSTDSTFGGLNFKELVAECNKGPSSLSCGGPRKVKLPSRQETVVKSSTSKRRMGTVEK